MQQSKQKVCVTHQEVIDQKNDNDKDQCKTCMEIQYKNEIIKVKKAIKEQRVENSKLDKEQNLKTLETIRQEKIQLTKEFNEKKKIKYSQQKLRKFNYQIIKEYPRNCYRSFVFNQDSTLLFAGEYNVIKLFKFKHGKKLLQKLTKHTNNIFSLIFMNKSNLLVSGSWDKSIVIWNQDCNWKPNQTLDGHSNFINIMINNEDENLLISGSIDQTIKFWRKINMNWSCQQTIQTNFKIKSLSLNKSQTKLLSCGLYSKEILVMELNSAQWYIKQTIQVNCYHGLQLCFISDSKFLYQGYQQCLEIYEYIQNERQFIKGKSIEVKKVENYDGHTYPCKYLETKGFAIIQCGKYLNFFGIDENQNCELSYSIDFNKNFFVGNISNDGQYLVTKDENGVMQVRKLNQLE